jgi:galactofuranosylgalactofuranosylrhamnosyl-N-acetylglucosaminyl-diphospho-decaprenol beta-1,5/1,6-galactofuranosyltransferase
VLRLNAFANLTPTPTIVGAQMLNLKNPRYLHVGAEEVNLTTLKPGRWAPNSLHSSDMVKHKQKKRTDAQYNGWWSCLIPAEIIAAVGLPLPIFIKWDDVEYSLRAGAAGFPTVTLPNAGVWHAEFHWKDLDDWTHYFIVRNSLITAALHSDIDVSPTGTILARVIAEAIISMRYGLAHTMIRALEDFLKGPSDLADGGMAAGASIRTERNEYSETTTHPAVKTGELTNALPRTRPAGFLPRKDRYYLVLAKRAVYQWLGRTAPGPVMIPAVDAHWWHVSLFDYAVVTDASQAGVRVLRRDKQNIRKLSVRLVKAIRRFRAEAPALQQQYRDALPELTSRENWARLFTS